MDPKYQVTKVHPPKLGHFKVIGAFTPELNLSLLNRLPVVGRRCRRKIEISMNFSSNIILRP